MHTSSYPSAWAYWQPFYSRLVRSRWGGRSLILAVALLLAFGLGEAAWALRRGNRGPEVTALQVNLRNTGFFQGQATGFYGSKTEAAVRNFQRAYGLPVDGIAGPQTLSTLYAANRPPVVVVRPPVYVVPQATPYVVQQPTGYTYSPYPLSPYPGNTGGVVVQPTYWVNPNPGTYWTYPNNNYVVTPFMGTSTPGGVTQRPIVYSNGYYYYAR
ncbi:peptidoglycan-binding domain-containing protein [Trichothermofontia sp.]